MNESRSPAETIFIEARHIVEASVRATYLQKACGDDPALRERVERMLQAEQKADQFFDNNPLELDDVPGVPADAIGKEGSVIGPYKLLQRIGEGGCGMVYMAEQEKPIRRRVALKVIKPGMDTRHVIARFEAERQALAMMDHPNIARVLDAGATDAGLPYFVMELVRGIKVTDYCDQNNLSTRDRLDLFTKVVQAVQHAHQKGIIHRDLKPSNVLVTLHDGIPIPKVIDFGIAKAIEQKLTDKTLFTQFEQFIGTPAYTSPEQAEMSGLDVDTRSDIYSLGVLLYELLVGLTPFDSKELLRSGINEMRRIIREQEPDRPSTRLSTMLAEQRTATAQHRAASSPDLIHLLKGDLDWIVMKCLEKDRTRRYDTASALATDIQNYLGNVPVTARPPSASYRFAKLVRRNKLAFAAGGAVALALVIGIVVSAWQANRAHRAEQSAKAEKESTEAVLNFFRDKVLAGGRPEAEGGLGKYVTLRKAIESAESQISETFKDRPSVEAAIRHTIGETYSDLGEGALAVAQLERALTLRRQKLGLDDPTTLHTMEKLATAYWVAEKDDLALQLDEQTFEIRKVRLGLKHPKTLTSMSNLGESYLRAGKLDKALPLLERAHKLESAAKGPETLDTLSSMANIARVHLAAGRFDQALPLFEDTLKRLRVKSPNHPSTIYTMGNLAYTYWSLGKYDHALALQVEGFKLSTVKMGPDHPHTLQTMEGLIRVFGAQPNHNLDLRGEALRELRKLKSTNQAVLSIRGRVFGSLGQWNEAAADFVEGFQIQPTDHLHYHHLTACLVQQGDLDAYRRHCRQIVARFAETKDPLVAHRMVKDCSILPDSGIDLAVLDRWTDRSMAAGEARVSTWFLASTGLVHYRQGRYASAADMMEKALKENGEIPERDVQAWMVLAMARHQLREYDQAQAALAQGLLVAETKLPKLESGNLGNGWVDWPFAHALIREARSLIEQGNQSADRAINQREKAKE